MGFAAASILPGGPSDLILEIPRMRIPHLSVLFKKTWWRTRRFMREAVPIFLAASFVIFVLDRTGGLRVLEDLGRPVVQGLFGLPEQAVQVLIKTAIRRENGATELGLLRAHFTNLQVVVTLLIMTFVMPCINATLVILKERGFKSAAAIFSVVVALALAVGATVNLLCSRLGITFSS